MTFGNANITGWALGRTTLSNGVLQVGSNGGNGNGAYLTAGGAWTNASDRNKKNNITSLNGSDVLNNIMSLPVYHWMYNGTNNEYHIGPMAQDFSRIFQIGDSSGISSIDPAGVALIGVQELKKENERKQWIRVL